MNTPDVHSVIEQLRGAYLRSLQQKLQALHHAVAARDFNGVAAHAHQLKGSGKSYGFPEISDIAARIEDASQSRQGSLVESLMVELERAARHLSMDSQSPDSW
jgi:HPt (histidine-containing phosphotransfer) domain-containing protein